MTARVRYYAFTRALDPGTGYIRVSGNTWVPGSPMVEVVLRIIRTPKGTFLPDPNFGVDYSLVEKARTNSGATFRAELSRALRTLVTTNAIRDLAIQVETKGTTLLWQIDFVDVRLGERVPILRGAV